MRPLSIQTSPGDNAHVFAVVIADAQVTVSDNDNRAKVNVNDLASLYDVAAYMNAACIVSGDCKVLHEAGSIGLTALSPRDFLAAFDSEPAV